MEYLSHALVLVLVALIVYISYKKQQLKKRSNVLNFRTYHRIEWLQKRRAAKLAKLKKEKK